MMAEPKFKDGDDDGGDDGDLPEISIEPPLAVWTDNPEEHRRTFVFDRMVDPAHDPRLAIPNMDMYCEWLKTGVAPKAKKPHLKPIPDA